MGFPDLANEAGVKVLNSWLATRSYIDSDAPSQADVTCFKAIASPPDVSENPHAARWYTDIASYKDEFDSLPGDASRVYTAYGPADEEEDVDLFASDDEEDEETARVRKERLAEYNARKAAKPKAVAKSLLTLDVKPWDDETNMTELEAAIRGIEREGLVWGASQLVSVGFGIKKLQITVVVADDKVSTQDLQDEIEGFEDYVQSTDIAAFQKL